MHSIDPSDRSIDRAGRPANQSTHPTRGCDAGVHVATSHTQTPQRMQACRHAYASASASASAFQRCSAFFLPSLLLGCGPHRILFGWDVWMGCLDGIARCRENQSAGPTNRSIFGRLGSIGCAGGSVGCCPHRSIGFACPDSIRSINGWEWDDWMGGMDIVG